MRNGSTTEMECELGPRTRGTEDKEKGSVMKEVFDLATDLMLLRL